MAPDDIGRGGREGQGTAVLHRRLSGTKAATHRAANVRLLSNAIGNGIRREPASQPADGGRLIGYALCIAVRCGPIGRHRPRSGLSIRLGSTPPKRPFRFWTAEQTAHFKTLANKFHTFSFDRASSSSSSGE